jgi:hypothetical protein
VSAALPSNGRLHIDHFADAPNPRRDRNIYSLRNRLA